MELEPDPVWTDRFERERERIERVSNPVATFHVGSTAVPDLPGRPELDVIAVYDDAETRRAAADALEAEGDRWKRTEGNGMIVIYWRDAPEAVYLKLHVVGDEGMFNQIAVRDYLRDNEEARRRYERVKREAATNHDEFGPYQEAKLDVVSELVEEARSQGYFDALPDVVRE